MANSISAGSSRRAIAARAANAAQQRCAVYFPRLLLDFWLAAHAWFAVVVASNPVPSFFRKQSDLPRYR
jgi:hypothetical protein